jgi:toxin ParE1/3/4
LGRRFYEEIERLILEIRSQPGRSGLFDPPVRRRLAKIFPYAVLYVNQPDRVLIIAVMHLKRRPGYWLERV